MKLNKALKIIIACGGFLFVCIFICINAHAEEIKNLPYDYSWNYTSIGQENIEDMLSHASSYIDTSSENLIVFWYEINNNTWFYSYCVAVVDDITYSNDKNYDNTNLLTDRIVLHFSDCYLGKTNLNNLWEDSNQAYAPENYTFFGNLTGAVHPDGYPFAEAWTNTPLYGTVQLDGDLIIGVPQDLTITGSATAPTFGAGNGVNGSDFLVPGADFGASVSQATKPNAPTITNYTWNTYTAPPVDTSTLESLIQSLIDIVKYNTTYIVGGITGLIENLLTNIQNMFAYIGALIEYSLRVLVTNIQNAIQNLYENFKSLVEPIFQLLEIVKEKVEYITEPFDKDEFFHQVDGNHLITACIHIEDYGEQLKSILTNAQERNTFHLNITYPKPDGTSFQTMISFDWLYPLRHLYMPYLWVFTILYLFFSACRLLGNVIGGKS